jgi:hypothetical protein
LEEQKGILEEQKVSLKNIQVRAFVLKTKERRFGGQIAIRLGRALRCRE